MGNGMKYLCSCVLGGLLMVGAVHAQDVSKPAVSQVKPDRIKLSYAIGYQIGSRFADGTPNIDLATMQRAIRDAYTKHKPAVSIQEMHLQLQRFQQQMHAEALREFKRIAAANARKSAAFMAANRRKPGVVQLPSGVQYSVLSKGSGKVSPSVTSTVVVNYRGMLVDGTEFDSTWAHGAPVSFKVDKVIRGWQDVIPRMHVGDRWKVVIPAKLAYGEEGFLPRIGPNEALRFEIELLAIKPASGKH